MTNSAIRFFTVSQAAYATCYSKSKMKKALKITVIVLLVGGIIATAALYLRTVNFAVLSPKGVIGEQERELIYFALGLSLLVVVPVFALLITFAWKYRASNKKATYQPDLDGSRIAETIWWLIPSLLILILSIVTWTSSHQLDPYKPIHAQQKPMTIQVVALDWKWLFIYPEQQVATVNTVQFPVNVPVRFELTADAPMNSFWIPQLGGQIYAMPGMTSELHLMADKAGDYRGSSANISGQGFAGMTFTAHASSEADFNTWIRAVKRAPAHLDNTAYTALAKPSSYVPPAYYSSFTNGLYDTIRMKYMSMGSQNMPMEMQ